VELEALDEAERRGAVSGELLAKSLEGEDPRGLYTGAPGNQRAGERREGD